MKRKLFGDIRILSDCTPQFSCNFGFGISNTVPIEVNPASDVRVVNVSTNFDCPCYKIQSDISLLLNQRRLLDVLGVDAVKNWLASLTNGRSDGTDTRKYSDEQLFQFVKSRHIQSHSELLSWSEMLNDEASRASKELKSFIDSLPVPEPAPAPDVPKPAE